MKLVEPTRLPELTDKFVNGQSNSSGHSHGGKTPGSSGGPNSRCYRDLIQAFLVTGNVVMEVIVDDDDNVRNIASAITRRAKLDGSPARGRTQKGHLYIIRTDEPLE